MRKTAFFSALSIAIVFSGCKSPTTTARSADLQKSYEVQRGTVIKVTEVVIDNSSGEGDGIITGAGAGALTGVIEDGSIEGAIAGAIVGGIFGGVVENVVAKENAYELDIKKADGTILRVLQRRKAIEGIEVGEEVEILVNKDGNTIVKRLNA